MSERLHKDKGTVQPFSFDHSEIRDPHPPQEQSTLKYLEENLLAKDGLHLGFSDSIIDEAYRIAIMSVDDEGNLDLEKIEKGFLELRSRPHPAPDIREHKETWYNEGYRQAREDLFTFEEIGHMVVALKAQDGWSDCEVCKKAINTLESLRQQAQPKERDQQ